MKFLSYLAEKERKEMVTYNYVLVALRLASQDWDDPLDCLAHIHADVRYFVLCELL